MPSDGRPRLAIGPPLAKEGGSLNNLLFLSLFLPSQSGQPVSTAPGARTNPSSAGRLLSGRALPRVTTGANLVSMSDTRGGEESEPGGALPDLAGSAMRGGFEAACAATLIVAFAS